MDFWKDVWPTLIAPLIVLLLSPIAVAIGDKIIKSGGFRATLQEKKGTIMVITLMVVILFLIAIISFWDFPFTNGSDTSSDAVKIVDTNYNCSSWSDEQYPIIYLFGERYVPLFSNNGKIGSSRSNKVAKLILDLPYEGEDYTIRTNEQLDLEQGYGLETLDVNFDDQIVWLEFTKDGEYVDDEIVSVASGSNNTWNVKLNNVQGVNNVVVFKVHIKRIFRGESEKVIQFDGFWLIDYVNATNL